MKTRQLPLEVIFKGEFHSLDISFLRYLIENKKNIYFNSPEISDPKSFDEIEKILITNTYVDLVINVKNLNINEKKVNNIFVNLGREGDNVEALFFLDIFDLDEPTVKQRLDYLKLWTEIFMKRYRFNYFICKMDNGNEDEYYFDIHGIGKLYRQLEE